MLGIAAATIVACAGLAPPEPAPRLPLYVLAKTGDRPPTLPEGTTFVDFNAPSVNGAGQIVYSALTMRPAEGGDGHHLGFGVFLIEPNGTAAKVLHHDVAPASGTRRWELHEDAECVVNERGQVAAIGIGSDVPPVQIPTPGERMWVLGGPRPASGQIVFGPAKGSTGHVEIVKEGDAAPGVDGDHVFHWFDCLTIDPEGAVYFRAGTAPRGRRLRSTLDATLSVWRAEPGEEPRPLLVSGTAAPGCDAGERVRFSLPQDWRRGGLVLTGDILAEGARPGDPSRAATWIWTRGQGLELVARTGDPMRGLEPPERVGMAHPVDLDDDGNVLFYGEPERPVKIGLLSSEYRTGVWMRSADGTWRKVVAPGDAVIDDGENKKVGRVLSARWALGGVLVHMGVHGENAARPRFPHGGYWLFAEGAAPRRVVADSLRAEGADWPGFVFRPSDPFDVGAGGDVGLGMGYGREKETGEPDRPRFAGIWVLTRDGRQRCVHLDGGKLDYAPGKGSVIERTSKSWESAVTGAGDVAFKAYFRDGTRAMLRSAAPIGR